MNGRCTGSPSRTRGGDALHDDAQDESQLGWIEVDKTAQARLGVDRHARKAVAAVRGYG
jgi:hypothetical protein